MKKEANLKKCLLCKTSKLNLAFFVIMRVMKFYNPFSGQEVERASPLPEDFKQVIEKLKD